jgi:hypothetical protein
MMNRSVMERQMFKYGGDVKKMMYGGDVKKMMYGGDVKEMQMGGEPTMSPPAGIAALEQAPAEPAMDMAGMGVGAVDQGTVEQMLTEVAPEIGDPEQAGSAEEMMNMVRGDEATVEERRMELATIVGEEDAMQTPESVLALVQPVVQMSMVDQGIGGLAEQEMQQPVEGDMAGGIMSMMGG